jgi:hypothetical protein
MPKRFPGVACAAWVKPTIIKNSRALLIILVADSDTRISIPFFDGGEFSVLTYLKKQKIYKRFFGSVTIGLFVCIS